LRVWHGPRTFDHLAGAILRVSQTRRDVRPPVRKRSLKRIKPFGDARFSGVDLLTASDEADDDRPIRVAIKTGNQELRLRHREVGIAAILHKTCRLLKVPSALSLIEDRDMLDRRGGINNTIVAKVVDVL